jgi:hypothetical protein
VTPRNEGLEQIADDDLLYRRLAPLHVNPDGTANSAAFKLRGYPDPQVSVDLARLTTPEATLARAPRAGFGLGALVAGDPRSLGLSVRHNPLPNNRAQALIEGQRPDDKQSARRLAEMTRILVLPRRE